MRARKLALPALAAALGIGVITPTADACWWLYRRKATTTTETRTERAAPVAAAPVAPIPGPPPGAVEGCTIESKVGMENAQCVKSQRRWVEAVYETREHKTYCPPKLEVRYREVARPAVMQTCYKQEWVAPVFENVCRKEWIPPTFKQVCREVKEGCQYQDVTFQKYIPPKVRCATKTRCVPDGRGGFTSIEDTDFIIEEKGRFETVSERKLVHEGGSQMVFETVQDKPGFFKEHIETVMVKPGYYRTVTEQMQIKAACSEKLAETVEVEPAKVETIQEKVLVKPAHWEEVAEEVTRNPC